MAAVDARDCRERSRRVGLVEFGDEDGDVVEAVAGFLPDELREELAYGDAAQVRWQRAQSLDHAEELLDER